MSISFNGGQFTVGPNNSVAIFTGGTAVDIGLITTINFMSKTRIEKKRINLMSGFTFELPFLQGWEGDMTIQRTDNTLDTFWFNNVESVVQAGGSYPSFNIIQTIKETDNVTITRLTFQGAVIYYDDAGTFENENGVMQKVSFAAPIRTVSS